MTDHETSPAAKIRQLAHRSNPRREHEAAPVPAAAQTPALDEGSARKADVEMGRAGDVRKVAFKRAQPKDDLVADYIAIATRPGDKSLQLGRSEFGTEFLRRGAFHEMIAAVDDVDAMQAACERRAISADRLRSASLTGPASKIDIALVGEGLGFPVLAGNWRRIASRLRIGGLLILQDADTASGARLADALMADKSWALQEMINGDVAVFRKTAPYCDETSRTGLGLVADPARRPTGLKEGLVAGVLRTLFGRRMSPALKERVQRLR